MSLPCDGGINIARDREVRNSLPGYVGPLEELEVEHCISCHHSSKNSNMERFNNYPNTCQSFEFMGKKHNIFKISKKKKKRYPLNTSLTCKVSCTT